MSPHESAEIGQPPLEGRGGCLRQSVWPKLSEQGFGFKQGQARVNPSFVEQLLHGWPTDLGQAMERPQRRRELCAIVHVCLPEPLSDRDQRISLSPSESQTTPGGTPKLAPLAALSQSFPRPADQQGQAKSV